MFYINLKMEELSMNKKIKRLIAFTSAIMILCAMAVTVFARQLAVYVDTPILSGSTKIINIKTSIQANFYDKTYFELTQSGIRYDQVSSGTLDSMYDKMYGENMLIGHGSKTYTVSEDFVLELGNSNKDYDMMYHTFDEEDKVVSVDTEYDAYFRVSPTTIKPISVNGVSATPADIGH